MSVKSLKGMGLAVPPLMMARAEESVGQMVIMKAVTWTREARGRFGMEGT